MDYMSKDFEEKCSQEIEESIKGRYEEENEWLKRWQLRVVKSIRL
jgi:hypothetical protein